MNRVVIVIISIFLLAGLGVAGYYYSVRQNQSDDTVATITPSPSLVAASPSPSPSPSFVASPVSTASPSPKLTAAATSVTLTVPFTPQAPDADWREPWGEGCEEAALLMAHAFNQGDRRETLPVAETKQKITDMVEWQKGRFGGHYDQGVDAMAIIAKEYLGYKRVTVKHGGTLEDIRNELRAGKPVIVPAAGQLLGNPYFTSPGPPYHAFTITGFEGNDFIVNENGTKRGRSYRYSSETLNKAIHDYKNGTELTSNPPAYLVLNN